MRLTHYEDGFLCGERFCINLIRHLFHLQASLWSFALQSSGTFSAVNIIQLYFENVLTPSPVSGKVGVKPFPIRHPKRKNYSYKLKFTITEIIP